MRKSTKGGEESWGGEVGLGEGDEAVDWERVWSRSVKDNGVPPALRELGYIFFGSFHWYCLTTLINSRRKDVHTIVTLTDNAPQGLNESLSCFPFANKVSPLLRAFLEYLCVRS